MAKFNEYPSKATPEDADSLMIYDAASKSNKLTPFSGIWNWIVGKLTNAVISNLQTNDKTVLGAINELNSKSSKTEFIDSGDTNTFTIKNIRTWIFIYTLGANGNNGNYGIFLYTPSYSNVPTIRNVIRADSSFTISAKISNNDVIIESNGLYLQGFAIYCQ